MKVAFVKDFLYSMRGGEKVLDAFCELYPDADIFSLFYVKGSLTPIIESHKIYTSFIQRLPFVKKLYRHYLPFYPIAVEQFDLREYDLVISQSQAVAKGAIVRPDALHICYCLSPMRYIWDAYHDYFPQNKMGLIKKLFIPPIANYLRVWDVTSSIRVDKFIAISTVVAKRIKRWYGRESEIVYPPCDTEFYTPTYQPREDFYLIVSALVPYKRIDLTIEAFKLTGKRLVVIGTGQDEEKLHKIVKGARNIEFLGWQSSEVIRDFYRRCRGFIFTGEEDFGIVLVEAQASGTPVIAFARGGATDILIDRETGLFFYEQKVKDIIEGVEKFESIKFDERRIRVNAERFSKEMFKREVSKIIKKYCEAKFS